MKSRIAYQVDQDEYIIIENGVVYMKMIHANNNWQLFERVNLLDNKFEYKHIDRDTFHHDLFERHDIEKY